MQNLDKIKANAVSVCERLGKYRQAFAWTAIYLMNVINGGNSLERDSDRDSVSSSSTTNSLGAYHDLFPKFLANYCPCRSKIFQQQFGSLKA